MSDDPFLATVEQYNQTRDFSDKAFRSICYAPFISLYFDQVGNVRVCCQNTTHVAGNVKVRSLDEIWHGEEIRSLREALVSCDLRQGCRLCEWQILDGNFAGMFMRQFDRFPVPDRNPAYPQQMEFSISNTCNLECVMCNGEWSSSIRSRRERKPPLEKAYGDAFFEQLRSYLPHLKLARFLGGEPFLARETLRIWDMMIELGLNTPCHVTTNGTQYNEKVERILQSLPMSFNVSIDGVTKETFERIRKNADHGEVLSNFKRFHDYARLRGTEISISHCLMTENWEEFGDLLEFADKWDCYVYVNTVVNPNRFSLYALKEEELRRVVEGLEARDEEYCARLSRNRAVWTDEIKRLRNRLEHVDDSQYFEEWGHRFEGYNAPASENHFDENWASEELFEWAGVSPAAQIDCNAEQVVTDIWIDPAGPLRFDRNQIIGRPIHHLQDHLTREFGATVQSLRFDQSSERIDNITSFGTPEGPRIEIRAITLPRYGDDGKLLAMRTLVGCRNRNEHRLVQIQP